MFCITCYLTGFASKLQIYIFLLPLWYKMLIPTKFLPNSASRTYSKAYLFYARNFFFVFFLWHGNKFDLVMIYVQRKDEEINFTKPGSIRVQITKCLAFLYKANNFTSFFQEWSINIWALCTKILQSPTSTHKQSKPPGMNTI